MIDFASTRNLYFPTADMIAALQRALPAVVRHSGSTQAVLNQKLARYLRCDAANVQVLHGASQIFPILKRLAGVRPVLRPEPTFAEYLRVFPKAAVYLDKPGIDLDDLDRSIPVDGIVLFVTPNSPTGTVIPTEWIRDCGQRHGHTLLVVDETHIDFSGHRPLVDLLEADPVPNILVIKSLGTLLGAPGLKIGYVYTSNPEIVRVLDDEIPQGTLSGPAEFYLDLILKFRDELEHSIEQTRSDRDAFVALLEATPAVLRVHPSGGPFVMVDLRARDPILGLRVKEALAEKFSMDVEDVSTRLGPHAPRLRLAVRLPEENSRFCEALSQVAATL